MKQPIAYNTKNDQSYRQLLFIFDCLSEQMWAAGWVDGIESNLFTAAYSSGPVQWGPYAVNVDIASLLRELAERCQAWPDPWAPDGCHRQPADLETVKTIFRKIPRTLRYIILYACIQV